MANSALKMLAQKAQKRLRTAGQNINCETEKTKSAYLSQASYAIVASKQTIEEDPLFEKVKKLISRDDVFNPLAELTDYSVFNNLSSLEKEKYIMDISKRYNDIKDFLSHSQNE